MHVLVGRNNFRARYRSVVPYQCVNIIASMRSALVREFYFLLKINFKINKEYYWFDRIFNKIFIIYAR